MPLLCTQSVLMHCVSSISEQFTKYLRSPYHLQPVRKFYGELNLNCITDFLKIGYSLLRRQLGNKRLPKTVGICLLFILTCDSATNLLSDILYNFYR